MERMGHYAEFRAFFTAFFTYFGGFFRKMRFSGTPLSVEFTKTPAPENPIVIQVYTISIAHHLRMFNIFLKIANECAAEQLLRRARIRIFSVFPIPRPLPPPRRSRG